ncbi:MAG: FHA domain-containing protein [Myxococcales bacterium]|nr:FHA domain-containing protein [Myxococcales bacterium]
MRYRLRFLLQEFDLPGGITVIGRSLDCNLTIEDPLVSRHHARIVIDDAGARVEDLNSRNGVRVNGVPIREPTSLRDGDRVRVGTQDLVFCGGAMTNAAHAKTTGVLRLCANCRLPYPREMVSCPHCEAIEQTEEGTLTGEEAEHGVSWTVQLLVEALDRALALGRLADAERIVRRATSRLDEYLDSGRSLDPEILGTVGAKVAAMTLATGDPTWVLWVLDVHRRLRAVPPVATADSLAEAATNHAAALAGPLRDLLKDLREAVENASADESDALSRLEAAVDEPRPTQTQTPEQTPTREPTEERGPDRAARSGDWPPAS